MERVLAGRRVRASQSNRHKVGGRRKPCAVDLHEGVEVTERGNHHASLLIVDCQVMRQALTLGCAPIICQRECGGLPDEVRGGFVFARLGEHLRKRFARMKIPDGAGSFAAWGLKRSTLRLASSRLDSARCTCSLGGNFGGRALSR
jgi:hypothetical protein